MDADGNSASSRKWGKSFVRVTSFGELQYSFYQRNILNIIK